MMVTDGVLIFDPMIPIWAIITLGFISALALAPGFFKTPLAAIMRLLATFGLICFLAQPQWRIEEKTPLDDLALIIADRSASQTLDERDRVTTTAVASLEERLGALGGVETETIDIQGEEETRIAARVKAAVANAPRERLSSIFIITDGQLSDSDALNTINAPPETPVHVLSTGRTGEYDRKITLINAPRYGIVRQHAEISFRVDDHGVAKPDKSEQAIVALRLNGAEAFRQSVPIGAEMTFRAPLSRPGPIFVELEVSAKPGELTERNNIAVLTVNAIRDRLRVLLISGEPHPGERVWRNLLKSDPAIDLVHFTILRPFDKNDGALQNELALIEFPRDELFIKKLAEFDLLIFDRYTYRGVLNAYHFDNIARYVENGGAVLVASGPEFFSAGSLARRRNLSFILPASPQGGAIDAPFRPDLSTVGERHPVTSDLPEQDFWGRWLRIIKAEKRAGDTLMESPQGDPLLILHRTGAGRVGLLLSDHVWLWARGFEGGGPHTELLRRIAHWLMKEPALEEERLTLTEESGDLIITQRTLKDDTAALTLTAPNGEATTLTLAEHKTGLYSTRINEAARGLYRARLGDLFAIGSVGLSAQKEFLDVIASPEKLAPLTKATGGGLYRIRRGERAAVPVLRRVRENASSKAGAGWAGVATRNAARIEAVRAGAIAPNWAWLAFIAAFILGAWSIEAGRIKPTRGRN